MITAIALMLTVGLMVSCSDAEEAIDNLDSQKNCSEYCSKHFACADHDPSDDESDSCVADCRNTIENNCGNEHQAAANDEIGTCIDKSCTEFRSCMVFEAAPECYGFVSE